MDESILLYAIAWVAIMGGIGMAVGAHRNRLIAGLVWGTLLGVFGWLLIWLGPTVDDKKKPSKRPAGW